LKTVQELVIYDAACRAIAAARTIDEVKEIANRAEAARAYARQAKNRQLEIDALEIRVRAERRLGEIIVALKEEGAGVQGRRSDAAESKWGHRAFVKLRDIGIDGNVSAIAQRLALLPEERFSAELTAWRATAPTAARLETPLQRYRVPTIRGDRQKQAQRLGRTTLDAGDRFAAFRAPDGRRIADWRMGELDRLEEIAKRQIAVIEAVRTTMPVVGDPLATLEMVFTPDELLAILRVTWTSVDAGDAGLRHRAVPRQAKCENCGCSFEARRLSGKAAAGLVQENRFCGRRCSALARSKARSVDGNARAAAD
jgi:hypothetical protein